MMFQLFKKGNKQQKRVYSQWDATQNRSCELLRYDREWLLCMFFRLIDAEVKSFVWCICRPHWWPVGLFELSDLVPIKKKFGHPVLNLNLEGPAQFILPRLTSSRIGNLITPDHHHYHHPSFVCYPAFVLRLRSHLAGRTSDSGIHAAVVRLMFPLLCVFPFSFFLLSPYHHTCIIY